MDRFRCLVKSLLFPKWWIVLLSVPVAATRLIYAFAFDHKPDWSAYVCYILSAVSFTWICARVVRSSGHWKQDANAMVERVPVAKRYLTDASFNTNVSLYRSLALNVLYALAKFAFGIYYRSVWFGTLAVYYFLLAVIRFMLLRHAVKNTFGADRLSEWKRYRLCGIFLLVINLALTGMVILIVQRNEGFNYPGYLIYIMAMYAFYSITVAIRSVVRYRKYQSPVMSSVRVLQLAAALVSMLALETAMLTQFGTENSPQFSHIMTGCTGGGVCTTILCIATYMLCRAAKEIKTLELEGKSI